MIHQCAVLGSPISHSLSPVLHQSAYEALGLQDWQYSKREVSQEQLGSYIAGMDSSWVGLSLTMPLKQTIEPLGHNQDQWSQRLGLANTAIFDWSGASWSGPQIHLYNTDVEGIVCALEEAAARAAGQTSQTAVIHSAVQLLADLQTSQPRSLVGLQASYAHATAVVVGTGNTARSAVAALSLLQPQSVAIVAHHRQHANHLVQLTQSLGMNLTQVCRMEGAGPLLASSQLVVSTVPAHAADPLAKEMLAAAPRTETGLDVQEPALLLDVAYASEPSALVSAWQRLGKGVALSGERMLLYQAVRQVALMTGRAIEAIPVAAMDTALRKARDE